MIKKWIENEQCSKSIKTFLSFAQIKKNNNNNKTTRTTRGCRNEGLIHHSVL